MFMEIFTSIGISVDIRKPETCSKLSADQILYRMGKLDSSVLPKTFPVFFTNKRIERQGIFNIRFRIVKRKIDSIIHSCQEISSLL